MECSLVNSLFIGCIWKQGTYKDLCMLNKLKWKKKHKNPAIYTGTEYYWLFMVTDFLITIFICWSVKCTLKRIQVASRTWVIAFSAHKKKKKKKREIRNLAQKVSYTFLEQYLLCVLVYTVCDRWLQLACLCLCFVWVHVRLSERTVLEYVGLIFVKDCS